MKGHAESEKTMLEVLKSAQEQLSTAITDFTRTTHNIMAVTDFRKHLRKRPPR